MAKEKKKIVSFIKGECVTVGILKKELENFDDNIPIMMTHIAGLVELRNGVLCKYNAPNEDHIELEEYDEEVHEDYITVLVLND